MSSMIIATLDSETKEIFSFTKKGFRTLKQRIKKKGLTLLNIGHKLVSQSNQ